MASNLMRVASSPSKASLLLLALLAAMGAGCTDERQSEQAERSQPAEAAGLGKLGAVTFPTSCSERAQPHFRRGVAALHSFWYPVALDEFREATRVDPSCLMGYWGEAMAHNHPIWGDPQETEAARQVLTKIQDTADLPPRERAWLQAVKVLYGVGDKAARDRAYSEAMEKIYRSEPDDVEAALFYALSLMGTVRPGDPAGEQTRLRAGEIASEVYKKNPNHPGAAHYVIHAYDDPQHARMALDAARRYAEIAPDAPHALHMPSHIFLQLGMWPEAGASNEASWTASDEWVKQKNLPISRRDYHSLHWLFYVYLQQGRYTKAEELLGVMRESLAQFPMDDPRNRMFGTFTLANMAATLLVETERWAAVEQLLGPPAETGEAKGQTASVPDPFKAYAVVARIPAVFARGLAAAAKGSRDARKSISELRSIREQYAGVPEPFVAQVVRLSEIQELEIRAMLAAERSNWDEAIQILRQAGALEEAMPPPSGPPTVIKPAHELYGEILLRAGRPKEAAEQFAISLRRHPDRARSLLGAARAAAKSGDTRGAADAYARIARQWQQADAQLPGLREAEDYAR